MDQPLNAQSSCVDCLVGVVVNDPVIHWLMVVLREVFVDTEKALDLGFNFNRLDEIFGQSLAPVKNND